MVREKFLILKFTGQKKNYWKDIAVEVKQFL